MVVKFVENKEQKEISIISLTAYANGNFLKTVVDLLKGKCMTRYLIL